MGIDAQSHPNQPESLGLSIALAEEPHQSCLDEKRSNSQFHFGLQIC